MRRARREDYVPSLVEWENAQVQAESDELVALAIRRLREHGVELDEEQGR